jgi:hypothetical protein
MPINWNKRKYSEQEFIEAWDNSMSIAQVARKLKLNIYGSTYQTLKDTASELGLSRDHMSGQGWLAGKTHGHIPKQPLDAILVNNRKTNGARLLKRLISERGWERVCHSCGEYNWLDKPIPLELEHKNGNNKDNRIENLSFLCPNCHAFTDTYRGKNIGRVME